MPDVSVGACICAHAHPRSCLHHACVHVCIRSCVRGVAMIRFKSRRHRSSPNGGSARGRSCMLPNSSCARMIPPWARGFTTRQTVHPARHVCLQAPLRRGSPVDCIALLHKAGIPARLVTAVIVSHCHADHDSGALQWLLHERKLDLLTTPTILGSFLRKYSALLDLPTEELRELFVFNAARLG